MNKVVLLGRLVRDPELKTSKAGKPCTMFSLAVNKRFKTENKPDADFFNVVAWGKQAEIICKYFKKGEQILIGGRLQSRTYTKDNVKHYITEVILEELSFVGNKNSVNVEDDNLPF